MKMYFAITAPGNGMNVVDGIHSTDKHYLKKQIELLGNLASKDTSNIRIFPSASKYVTIKIQNTVYTCSIIMTG